jgi:hypothetical protein
VASHGCRRREWSNHDKIAPRIDFANLPPPPEAKIMSKDAQLTLAMPGRLARMAGLNRAQADPAGEGAPHGLELRHLRYFVAVADAGTCTRATMAACFAAYPWQGAAR